MNVVKTKIMVSKIGKINIELTSKKDPRGMHWHEWQMQYYVNLAENGYKESAQRSKG